MAEEPVGHVGEDETEEKQRAGYEDDVGDGSKKGGREAGRAPKTVHDVAVVGTGVGTVPAHRDEPHGEDQQDHSCNDKHDGGPDAVTKGDSQLLKACHRSQRRVPSHDESHQGDDTELLPYSTPQGDPYGGIPNPAPCVNPQPLVVDGAFTAPANACYSSVFVQPSGVLTIPQGGTFTVYGGNLDIKGDVKMATGTGGVTIVMTGPEKTDGSGQVTAGTLEMESQANLSLTAPPDGDYADLIFYRDRRAPPSTIKIRGGAASTLKGGFYAATSDMDFAGNSGFTAECLQMVGQIIAFTGTSDLVNECPDDSEVDAISRNVVRLVE